MFAKRSIAILFSLLVAVLLVPGSVAARPLADPLSTGFTYQGRLTDGGAPANGTYDFQFSLFNAPSSGVPVGPTINMPGVTVTNGLFTVQLDFGNVFDGTALYLQIAVRPAGGVGYTLLGPLQPLSATPYALYTKQAGNADRLDGQHASDFIPAAKNLIIVAKSGGNFLTITAALDSIKDASDTNRYLIYIAPGVYDEQVTMKQYVDIQGSGELTTKITSAGTPSDNSGTVIGANDAELRFLMVESTGGGGYAIPIYNNNASPRLTHITANANTSSVSYGVYNVSSAPIMTDVTVSAASYEITYGIYNVSSSSPTMTNVSASASGGDLKNYGMNNISSSVTINNSIIKADSGGLITSNLVAIYNDTPSGNYLVLVTNSQIISSDETIRNSAGFTTRIAASELNGGGIDNSGTLTCAGVYDENYTFYTSTCP